MDRELILMIVGAGIALTSSIVTALIQHILSIRVDRIRMEREQQVREEERMLKERELREKMLLEMLDKVRESGLQKAVSDLQTSFHARSPEVLIKESQERELSNTDLQKEQDRQ